jgi:hypothetical protein
MQLSWNKELSSFEKELSKINKSSLKNLKCIKKINTKIECTNFATIKDRFLNEVLKREEDNKLFETSTQEIENKIFLLQNEIIKIKGRRLISELINKLSYMHLKWERSRQIEISDIYKN